MLMSFKRIFSLSFFVQAKIFFSSMYISPFKLSNIPEIAYKNVVFPEPGIPISVMLCILQCSFSIGIFAFREVSFLF